MAGTAVPYRWISELPVRAQRELERNFLHLQTQVGSGVSTIYDAIIDPAATSNASSHIYKNLTDLLNSETLVSTRTFTVGVVPRNDTVINETNNMTVPGPIAISALGRAGTAAQSAFGNTTLAKWDMKGFQINSTAMVYMQGLQITNTGTATSQLVNGATGVAIFVQCRFMGTNGTTTSAITAPTSASTMFAWDSHIECARFNGSVVAVDCNLGVNLNMAMNPNSNNVFWDGGSVVVHAAATVTFSGSTGSTSIYFRMNQVLGTEIDGGSSGSFVTWSIGNAGYTYFEITGTVNGMDVGVTSGAGQCTVVGEDFRNITIATGTTKMHNFRGSLTGTLSFTGPGMLDAYIQTGAGATATIGGKGVTGRLQIRAMSATPWTAFVGLVDSVLQVSYDEPGTGQKAYTVDSGSARSVIVTAGTTEANFSVASTNAGTNVRIITETGDIGGISVGASPPGVIDFSQSFLLG